MDRLLEDARTTASAMAAVFEKNERVALVESIESVVASVGIWWDDPSSLSIKGGRIAAILEEHVLRPSNRVPP
jgi:hypothetical protein